MFLAILPSVNQTPLHKRPLSHPTTIAPVTIGWLGTVRQCLECVQLGKQAFFGKLMSSVFNAKPKLQICMSVGQVSVTRLFPGLDVCRGGRGNPNTLPAVHLATLAKPNKTWNLFGVISHLDPHWKVQNSCLRGRKYRCLQISGICGLFSSQVTLEC